MKIKRLFYLWVVLCIMFTPVLIFSGPSMVRIIFKDYRVVQMKIERETFGAGGFSKTPSATLMGTVNKSTNVYCGLSGNDISAWTEYLPDILSDSYPTNIDYDYLSRLKLSIPVIQLGNSRSVLFIKKGETVQTTLNSYFYPALCVWSVLYIPLIILFILKKRYHE